MGSPEQTLDTAEDLSENAETPRAPDSADRLKKEQPGNVIPPPRGPSASGIFGLASDLSTSSPPANSIPPTASLSIQDPTVEELMLALAVTRAERDKSRAGLADLQLRNRILASALHDAENMRWVELALCELIEQNKAKIEHVDPEILDASTDAQISIRRQSNISDDAMTLNRALESKEFPVVKKPLDIQNFLEETIRLCKGKCKIINPKKIKTVQVDETHFRRVIMNLIWNAKKFSFKGDEPIEIILDEDEQTQSISVKDRGCGLPKDKDPEDLFNIHVQKNEELHGFGIGLYSSKLICLAHGGNITAKNNDDGSGATFTVKIPRTVGISNQDMI